MVIHCHTVGPEPSAFDVSRAIRGTGAGARSSVGGAGGAGGGRMKRCASCVVSVHKLLWIGGDGGGALHRFYDGTSWECSSKRFAPTEDARAHCWLGRSWPRSI